MSDNVQPLTAADVAAFRAAEDASAHHHEGQSFIRLYVGKHGSPNVLTARQQRLFPESGPFGTGDRQLTVKAHTYAYNYSGGQWTVDPKLAAFATLKAGVTKSDYHAEWRTIVDLLRVGDVLTLSWVADNNSEVTRAAGHHRDELALVVTRGKRTFKFHLATQVGPDNSARMVRRNG